MIFNEQMQIINKIIEIKNSRTEDFSPMSFDFELEALCRELEQLATAPHIVEKERFRKMYLAAASKNIPNLNDSEKKI